MLREQGVGLPPQPAAPGEPASDAAQQQQQQQQQQPLYYWPAYEMVKEGFVEPYLDDGRHVKPGVVRQILEVFGEHYLVDAARERVLDAERSPSEAAPAGAAVGT